MRVWFRRLHLVIAWLFVAAVVFQVYLAGRAIFVSERYWQDHLAWAWTGLPLIALLVLLSAVAGGLPGSAVRWAALPLLGVFVQFVMAAFRYSGQTEIAALHPVTALIVFGLGVVVARRASAFVGEAAPTASLATAHDPQ
jgi:putative tricarboxylic transport membrane protein